MDDDGITRLKSVRDQTLWSTRDIANDAPGNAARQVRMAGSLPSAFAALDEEMVFVATKDAFGAVYVRDMVIIEEAVLYHETQSHGITATLYYSNNPQVGLEVLIVGNEKNHMILKARKVQQAA